MPAEGSNLKTVDVEEFPIGEQTPIPCFRCGTCCTCYQAPVVDRDSDNISSALGISSREFVSRYALKVPIKEGYLLRRTDAGCVFLAREEDGRARCTIHRFRPRACREWQPGLSRPACLDGLARLKAEGKLWQLDGFFGSEAEKRAFYRSLEESLATAREA